MLTESINFNAIPWQSTLSGARSKTFQQDGKQLRIVEFTDEFVESDWCINGHVGYVLEGTLEIDFNGRLVIYPKGSGIFIPAVPRMRIRQERSHRLPNWFWLKS